MPPLDIPSYEPPAFIHYQDEGKKPLKASDNHGTLRSFDPRKGKTPATPTSSPAPAPVIPNIQNVQLQKPDTESVKPVIHHIDHQEWRPHQQVKSTNNTKPSTTSDRVSSSHLRAEVFLVLGEMRKLQKDGAGEELDLNESSAMESYERRLGEIARISPVLRAFITQRRISFLSSGDREKDIKRVIQFLEKQRKELEVKLENHELRGNDVRNAEREVQGIQLIIEDQRKLTQKMVRKILESSDMATTVEEVMIMIQARIKEESRRKEGETKVALQKKYKTVDAMVEHAEKYDRFAPTRERRLTILKRQRNKLRGKIEITQNDRREDNKRCERRISSGDKEDSGQINGQNDGNHKARRMIILDEPERLAELEKVFQAFMDNEERGIPQTTPLMTPVITTRKKKPLESKAKKEKTNFEKRYEDEYSTKINKRTQKREHKREIDWRNWTSRG